MVALRIATHPTWTTCVVENFDAFLVDHGACERKAAATGMSFVVRYPDRTELLEPMIAFAREELEHFQQVVRIIVSRGLMLAPDEADPYVGALGKHMRTGRDERLLDRLLMAAVVEARGCERFGLVAAALDDRALADFYAEITRSEARHHGLFVRLARLYCDERTVQDRLDELLDVEASIVDTLPIRAALH